jgi:hypothetical protein
MIKEAIVKAAGMRKHRAGILCHTDALENIGRALLYRPFAPDVSGGAETDGFRDRKK